MSSIVVVGTQWGDEGKGKITISSQASQMLSRVFQVVIMQAILI